MTAPVDDERPPLKHWVAKLHLLVIQHNHCTSVGVMVLICRRALKHFCVKKRRGHPKSPMCFNCPCMHMSAQISQHLHLHHHPATHANGANMILNWGMIALGKEPARTTRQEKYRTGFRKSVRITQNQLHAGSVFCPCLRAMDCCMAL